MRSSTPDKIQQGVKMKILGTFIMLAIFVVAMFVHSDKEPTSEELAAKQEAKVAHELAAEQRRRSDDAKRQKWMKGCSASEPAIDPGIHTIYFTHPCCYLQSLASEVVSNGWRCDTVHSISVKSKLITLRCNQARYVYLFEDVAGTWIIRIGD